MKTPYRLARLLTVPLLALLLVACAQVRTTNSGAVGIQRTQYMSSLVSETQLDQMAERQYREILAQARARKALDVSREQTARVQGVARRLIAQVGVFRQDALRWDWQVHVLQSREINAWCMPGGRIAVYSGLLERIRPTDDELAAVLGHEIAHALREHVREQMSRQMAADIGLSVLAAVTGSRAAADMGATFSQVMFTLPNSRDNEIEADRMGVELAARAGFDPRAAISLWQKMERVGGSAPPEFLSTHPSSASRIRDLEQSVRAVMPLYEKRGS